jgi:hypothetical protein
VGARKQRETGKGEELSTTIYRRANDKQTRLVVGETLLVTRAADFEELFYELVEEAGRALEEGDLDWCAILQGYLIPKIEAEGLRIRRTGS